MDIIVGMIKKMYKNVNSWKDSEKANFKGEEVGKGMIKGILWEDINYNCFEWDKQKEGIILKLTFKSSLINYLLLLFSILFLLFSFFNFNSLFEKFDH